MSTDDPDDPRALLGSDLWDALDAPAVPPLPDGFDAAPVLAAPARIRAIAGHRRARVLVAAGVAAAAVALVAIGVTRRARVVALLALCRAPAARRQTWSRFRQLPARPQARLRRNCDVLRALGPAQRDALLGKARSWSELSPAQREELRRRLTGG